jgi:predicted transcriptional regulator
MTKMMSQVLSSWTRTAARRSAFEVMMDILKVTAAGSSKPTHIMYRSNTSWIVLQKNLESLIASGFVLQNGYGPKAEFAITQKGLAVLHDYVNLIERAAVHPIEVRM